jgi:hypothetical protein
MDVMSCLGAADEQGLTGAAEASLPIAWSPAREAEPPCRHRARAVIWNEDLIALESYGGASAGCGVNGGPDCGVLGHNR